MGSKLQTRNPLKLIAAYILRKEIADLELRAALYCKQSQYWRRQYQQKELDIYTFGSPQL